MAMPTKQAQKSQRTKAAIIAAATRLMRRHGFENTSIRQICNEAKVSTGSFYHLFKSKDEIVDVILHEVNACYIEPRIDYEKDSPYTAVEGLIQNHLSVVRTLSPEIVFNAIFHPANGNKTMFSNRRSMMRYLLTTLEGFRQSGKLRTDIPLNTMERELSECFFGTFYAVYTMEEMDQLEERLRAILTRLYSTYVIDRNEAPV